MTIRNKTVIKAKVRLVRPSAKYRKTFVSGMIEFERDEGDKRRKVEEWHDFPAFIKRMRDHEIGRNLPKGYIPSSYYWLVDESGFIGETTIRHCLTKALRKDGGHIGYGIRPSKRKMGFGKKILALALRKAKKLGIHRVLVTCDSGNMGSRKIIEINGGVLWNKIRLGGKLRRRYWIKIANY